MNEHIKYKQGRKTLPRLLTSFFSDRFPLGPYQANDICLSDWQRSLVGSDLKHHITSHHMIGCCNQCVCEWIKILSLYCLFLAQNVFRNTFFGLFGHNTRSFMTETWTETKDWPNLYASLRFMSHFKLFWLDFLDFYSSHIGEIHEIRKMETVEVVVASSSW